MMTTETFRAAATGTRVAPALLAGAIGVALIVLAGIAQATVLHDAAHDVRHATGFPCH